jgi:O-antigen ligase
MGVDYGVPGFVAFIALVTIVLGLGLRTIVRTRHRAEEALAIGLLAGYLVYLVHGFMDAVTFSTKPAIIVWMIAGIIVASERMTANAHARSEVGVQN